jgi:hypothetical protein
MIRMNIVLARLALNVCFLYSTDISFLAPTLCTAGPGLPGDNLLERTRKKLPGLKRPTEIQKVILCSGKIFYHLYHRRAALQLPDVTFIRLEQVAPFPFEVVARAILRYPKAGEWHGGLQVSCLLCGVLFSCAVCM